MLVPAYSIFLDAMPDDGSEVRKLRRMQSSASSDSNRSQPFRIDSFRCEATTKATLGRGRAANACKPVLKLQAILQLKPLISDLLFLLAGEYGRPCPNAVTSAQLLSACSESVHLPHHILSNCRLKRQQEQQIKTHHIMFALTLSMTYDFHLKFPLPGYVDFDSFSCSSYVHFCLPELRLVTRA